MLLSFIVKPLTRLTGSPSWVLPVISTISWASTSSASRAGRCSSRSSCSRVVAANCARRWASSATFVVVAFDELVAVGGQEADGDADGERYGGGGGDVGDGGDVGG